ncbi:MAG: glycerol-3-phosphate acyltransferase [Anaerotruncus massiliensis (ex Togo et al. 2019)]
MRAGRVPVRVLSDRRPDRLLPDGRAARRGVRQPRHGERRLRLGAGSGLLVLAGDILKTAAACASAGVALPGMGRMAVLYAGLGAVLGHCWPVWNGFRGGKGVAVAGAASILFSPPVGIASYLLGAAAVLATGYLAVGSAVIAVSLPLLTALFGLGREAAAAAGVIGGVMLLRHSGNFARMRAGTKAGPPSRRG